GSDARRLRCAGGGCDLARAFRSVQGIVVRLVAGLRDAHDLNPFVVRAAPGRLGTKYGPNERREWSVLGARYLLEFATATPAQGAHAALHLAICVPSRDRTLPRGTEQRTERNRAAEAALPRSKGREIKR